MPGLEVTLYADDPAGPTVLQTVATTTVLYPGQTEMVAFSVPTPQPYHGQTVDLFVVVDDDGTGAGSANECKEENNRVVLGSVYCEVVE
jgi:hypothetical protein